MQLARLSLRVDRTVVRVGEAIEVSGSLSPPIPYLPVIVTADEAVVARVSADVGGNYSASVILTKPGKVLLKATCLAMSSDPVLVEVTRPPPPPPPPEAPPVYVPPETKVPELDYEKLKTLVKEAVREVLKEEGGFTPNYYYEEGVIAPGESIKVEVPKKIGKVGKEGYLSNDGADSLYLSLNDGTFIKVKSGEWYQFFKREVSMIRVENRSSLNIEYRLEVR
jgi:hypothetical protein